MRARLRRALSQIRCLQRPRITVFLPRDASAQDVAQRLLRRPARRRQIVVLDRTFEHAVFAGKLKWRFERCTFNGPIEVNGGSVVTACYCCFFGAVTFVD